MKHKSKSIKFFLVCVILLVVLFFAAVGYLTFLTASFAKSDGQPSNTQQIVSISDDGTVNVTTEDVIKNRLYKIKVVAFILSGMMIFDIMLMIFYFWIYRTKNEKLVRRIAYFDEVTGLPIKDKHRIDIEARLKDKKRDYAYTTFDINNFKYINDIFGYTYGNSVLQHVADMISERLESDELMTRISGARFGMLLRYTDDEALYQRVMAMFDATGHLQTEDKSNIFNLMFTCGVYRIRWNDRVEELMEYSFLTLDSAKRLFSNNIEFYNEELRRRKLERDELEYDMRPAFEDKQFTVFYQPKYNTKNKDIVGAEALVRWMHPQKGLISPDSFVPLFEANGFIVKIDMFVLENVCLCLRKWLDDGVEPVALSVNLSRVHLYDNDLVEHIVSIVDKYHIPHALIEFELTETALFDELDILLQVMNNLKQAGFILSMDDFGSGYSSLNMLKRLPVDILKLDKGFLKNFEDNEGKQRDRTIITHIITMAKALDMDVLVEGVETEWQHKFLLSAECDMMQGYYCDRPMEQHLFDEKYRIFRKGKLPMD